MLMHFLARHFCSSPPRQQTPRVENFTNLHPYHLGAARERWDRGWNLRISRSSTDLHALDKPGGGKAGAKESTGKKRRRSRAAGVAVDLGVLGRLVAASRRPKAGGRRGSGGGGTTNKLRACRECPPRLQINGRDLLAEVSQNCTSRKKHGSLKNCLHGKTAKGDRNRRQITSIVSLRKMEPSFFGESMQSTRQAGGVLFGGERN